MKILQAIILRLFSLLILLGGVMLVAYAFGIEDITRYTDPYLPLLQTQLGLMVAGGCAVVLGLFGLLPLFGKPNNTVHFENAQGSVVINVRSLERYLSEVLVRMPEVETIDVDVVPIKKGKKVRIEAHAKINQPVTASGRATSDRVTELIKEAATSFIGLEEDTPIHLTVDWIDINVEEASQILKDTALPMPDASRGLPSYNTARLQQKSLGSSATTGAIAADVADPAPDVMPAAYAAETDGYVSTGDDLLTRDEDLAIAAEPIAEATPSETVGNEPTEVKSDDQETAAPVETPTGEDSDTPKPEEKKPGWGKWGF